MFTIFTCFWFLFYSFGFYLNIYLFLIGGKLQVNPDGSVSLEGHIFVLNSIHSFLVNKIIKQQSNTVNASESFDLRSGNIIIKVMSGKLIEQNVDGIMYVFFL